MTHSYQIHLVLLSCLVAILATYASLNVVSRISAKTTKDKLLLLLAAFIMAGGIWTMHFIGMEAYHFGMPVVYNSKMVILSLVWPVISTLVSFWIFWHGQHKKVYFYISGIIMGIGIVGMHYSGMSAMQMDAKIIYDPLIFSLTIILAITVSLVGFRFFKKLSKSNFTHMIIGSFVFGLAVSSVHYTGMMGVMIDPYHLGMAESMNTKTNFYLGIGIDFFLIFIFSVILISSFLDQKYALLLKDSEERYRLLVELAPIGIAIHKFGKITYMNPAGLQIISAKSIHDVIDKSILEIIHPDYHNLVRKRWKHLSEEKTVEAIDEKLITMENQVVDVSMSAIPMVDEGELLVQIFFSDITDRKKAEALVYNMAFHDPLTELPNRRLFYNRLNQLLNDSQNMAIFFIDLDGFKAINDTLGHEAGDDLLKKVAKLLLNTVRKDDIVSRFAGDEFMVLMPNISREETVTLANNMIKVFQSIVVNEKEELTVTASIGITFSKGGKVGPEELIKQADMAMFQAKKLGKNTYHIFNELD